MKIVIEQCRYAPKWETLQELLRQTTANYNAVITKIDRRDNGCDYGSTGVYDIRLDQGNQTYLPIVLEVVAVGHRPTILKEDLRIPPEYLPPSA